MEVDHEELKKLIKTAYKNKKPLNVVGHIGIGKSETVKYVAKELANDLGIPFAEGSNPDSFGFVDIRLSQMDPSDIRGLPMYNNETKTTEWYPPEWLPTAGSGILFFDEINLAPQIIQGSAYQLILDRKLGKYTMPDGWIVVAAGNLVDDRTSIYEMSAPLANRFVHATLTPPSKDKWIDWAMDNDTDSDIMAYISYKPTELYKFDSEKAELAFATPRTWKYASDLIKDKKINDRETLILVSSAVGDGVGREFMAFRKLKEDLDIDKILDDAGQFVNPTRVDIKYSLTSALAAQYKNNRKLLPNILKIWNKMDPEFVVLSVRLCQAAHKTSFIADVGKISEAQEFISKYTKYFKSF